MSLENPINNKTKKVLKEFSELVEILNKTQGSNKKIEILKTASPNCQDLIKHIWNPDTTTGVTMVGIRNFEKSAKSVQSAEVKDIIQLMEDLTERKITGDLAKATCVNFANQYPEYKDLIYGILEKNPRIRLGATMILQAFPGIFSIFKVSLAKEYTQEIFNRQIKSISWEPKALLSKKYDGVRVTCIIKDGKPRFYSREGGEFVSLEMLETDFKANILGNLTPEENKEGVVFDGEVLEGNGENFKETVSQIKQDKKQMPNPHYYVFDYMRLSVFEGRAKGDILNDRVTDLKELIGEGKPPKNIFITEQIPYSETNFALMEKRVKDQGWEGFMVRINTYYENKRTNNLLKVKTQNDAEYTVKDVVIKEMPFVNSSGGETFQKALNSIIIEHKGNTVHVGSGFSKEERLMFAKDPSLILGHEVTIKYQEEFYNPKTKLYSLRCPIFKTLYSKEGRNI